MVSTAELIHYLEQDVIRRPDLTLTPDTPLVSSGLIDSFMLVDLIVGLEKLWRIEIPPGAVQAEDMETARQILTTVQRFA